MMSKEIYDFWLVWNSNSSYARKRHQFKENAMAEADRLSKLRPGHKFYVLGGNTGDRVWTDLKTNGAGE